jgi:ferritin
MGKKIAVSTFNSEPMCFAHALMNAIEMKEKDYATQIFLQWFVTEQIEEERNDNEIISKLKLIGDNTSSLFIHDKELSIRVFTLSADEE